MSDPTTPANDANTPGDAGLAALATAELLAVGAELLVGDTRDTNSGDLAGALTDVGVEVTRMSQLPDHLGVVTDAVRSALERVDLVITTGGLGPTPDDLTRESIAAAIGRDVVIDPELEAWLRDIWARRGLPFSDTNLKQAWLVEGATSLPNPHGTAPGWWVEVGAKVIIALPGPPRELHPMWQDHALARLQARGLGTDRAAETLHLTGIGESVLVDVVGNGPLNASNPRMATYARADSVDLRVSANGESGVGAQQLVDEAVAALSPRLDAYVFARGDDGWREAIDVRLAGRTLATIEAGTAGYLGLLLGTAPWLVLAEQVRDDAPDGHQDPGQLVRQIRERSSADACLAVVAHETGDDMRVMVATLLGAELLWAERSVFRGGDAGRRRAANAALAELWQRLADAAW